jgi:dimethylamine monooxygenase subunit A
MRVNPGNHLPFDPFDGKPFRLRIGARPLEMSNWLVLDEESENAIDEKYRLMQTAEGFAACVALPIDDVSATACAELVRIVGAHMRTYEPEHLDRQLARVSSLGECADIDRAGRFAVEDFCVLTRPTAGEPLRLTAATLCFPSRWRLAEKLGQELIGIHEPVPEYESALGRPTNSALDRVTPEKPFWRMNWSVSDDPRLHQPTGHFDPTAGSRVSDVGNDVYLRVERQTLVCLPESRAVVFGIRTLVRSLSQVLASDATVAERIVTTLTSLPDGMRAYKSLGLLGPRVVDWLRSQSNSQPVG